MAAVTGDAENINKQARILRTNWVTNKQTADGFLPRWRAPVPPSSADGPLHPSRTDHVDPTIAVVGSLVM